MIRKMLNEIISTTQQTKLEVLHMKKKYLHSNNSDMPSWLIAQNTC